MARSNNGQPSAPAIGFIMLWSPWRCCHVSRVGPRDSGRGHDTRCNGPMVTWSLERKQSAGLGNLCLDNVYQLPDSEKQLPCVVIKPLPCQTSPQRTLKRRYFMTTIIINNKTRQYFPQKWFTFNFTTGPQPSHSHLPLPTEHITIRTTSLEKDPSLKCPWRLKLLSNPGWPDWVAVGSVLLCC